MENTEQFVENRTYDEIQIGDSSTLIRTLQSEDIRLFAVMSGDANFIYNPQDSSDDASQEVVAYGMWAGSLISTVIGSQFPGPGTCYVNQNLRFLHPVAVGDTISVVVTVQQKIDGNQHVIFDCSCSNQEGVRVVEGTVEVKPPLKKIRHKKADLPPVVIGDKKVRQQNLLARVKNLAAIDMAVAYPCDAESLKGAVFAAQAGIIDPILIGPEAKIRSVAEKNHLDITPYRIVNVEHTHEAAAMAVTVIRNGDAEALMKGSLHTDELMSEVVSKAAGLRTNRRITHVFLMDVPTNPRPFMITDAAVNIAPTLEEKVHIVQNAIDLAHMMGIPQPKVAILSAVETINPKIQSTLDAAALCKMADRGQIKGGILDGPLAFDNAISLAAAKTKGISTPVAGQVDILVVPNLESGNMLAKQLEYLAHALTTGIVLGTRVPIVLTSRADTAEARSASCAIAAIIAHANREKAIGATS